MFDFFWLAWAARLWAAKSITTSRTLDPRCGEGIAQGIDRSVNLMKRRTGTEACNLHSTVRHILLIGLRTMTIYLHYYIMILIILILSDKFHNIPFIPYNCTTYNCACNCHWRLLRLLDMSWCATFCVSISSKFTSLNCLNDKEWELKRRIRSVPNLFRLIASVSAITWNSHCEHRRRISMCGDLPALHSRVSPRSGRTLTMTLLEPILAPGLLSLEHESFETWLGYRVVLMIVVYSFHVSDPGL